MSSSSPTRPRPLRRRVPASCVPTIVESLECRRLLAVVTVDTDHVFQTIGGIGGNYAQGRKTGSSYVNDGVGQYTLDHLSVAHARIGIPLKAWEPINDDADANTVNPGGFVNSGNVRNVFLLMQDLHRRGIPISAAIWDAPNWMVQNPEMSEDRVVAPVNYAELSESIEQFLVTARDVYGVPVETVSFNEADLGYFLNFTAREHANFIKLSGPRTEALELPAKWLVGDAAQVAGAYDYARLILEDAEARPYLGAVAYHSWTALTATDVQFTRIADLAAQYGKQVWCTEVGYDSSLHYNQAAFSTWDYGAKLARTYHRVLKLSRASVLHYWEYQNDYPLVNPSTLTPNPAFYVVKELAEGLPPGAQIVAADSDNPSILALAGKHVADESFMLQLVNTSTSSQQVSINGLPSSALRLIRSSATHNGTDLGAHYAVNGILTLTLPADSVSTLRSQLGVPSPWQGRDIGMVGIAGREAYDGGVYHLRGSGSGIAGSNDAFHFVHQAAQANASIIARLIDPGSNVSGAEAGVMIRDGIGSIARYAAIVLDGESATFRYRNADGAAAVVGGHIGKTGAPQWVQLVREGNLFTASVSADASTWTVVGTATISMPTTAQIGLVSTSGDNSMLAASSFDQVRASALPVTFAPGRLAAVQVAHNRVDLSWVDYAGNEEFFEVERSTDGVNFELLATVATNVPRYSDTSAAPGTMYTYRVRAANGVGHSTYSVPSRARTATNHEAENATLSATGVRVRNEFQNYTGSGYVDYQAAGGSVQWTIDVPYTGGYALEFRYAQGAIHVPTLDIEVDGAIAASALTFPSTGSYHNWANREVNVQLTAGTHTVRAIATSTLPDLVNLDSLRVRPQIAPAPANFAARAINGKIQLSWNDSPLSSDMYRIERSLDGISFTHVASTSSNATGWIDPTAELLVPYFYQVRAFGPGGDSPYTPVAVATIPTPPADPAGLFATVVHPMRIDLRWDDLADNEDGYLIEQSVNGSSWAPLLTTAPNTTSYSALAMPGSHHSFRIRAVNGGGESAHVSAEAVTPPVTVFTPGPGAAYSFGGTATAPLLTVFGGSVTFTKDARVELPELSIIIHSGAHVTFGVSQHLNTLTVGASSTASMSPGGGRFLHTKALNINATGRFDMADNDVIWDYTGASQYGRLKHYVVTGRTGSGSGGITVADSGRRALAVVDNAQFGRTSWMGQPIDSTTVIGKYAYFGDSNLDGKVTGDDYVSIDTNLGRNPGTSQWFHGDFNFDGHVTGDDYVSIDANLGAGTLNPSAYDADRAELIELHAEQFDDPTYAQKVEKAARGKPTSPRRGSPAKR